MKCSGENVILRGIVHEVSGFPLHFMFYRENLDCFSNRVGSQKMRKNRKSPDRVTFNKKNRVATEMFDSIAKSTFLKRQLTRFSLPFFHKYFPFLTFYSYANEYGCDLCKYFN